MSRMRVFLGGGANGFPRVSGDEPALWRVVQST